MERWVHLPELWCALSSGSQRQAGGESPGSRRNLLVKADKEEHGPTERDLYSVLLTFLLHLKKIISGVKREKEREIESLMMRKNQRSAAFCTPPTGERTHNPGICP